MFRLCAMALFFVMLGCGGRNELKDWKLPGQLDGGWKLAVHMPTQETFSLINKLEAAKSVMSGYEREGGGKLVVLALGLKSETNAFEQVQKWHAQPGKLAFYRGPWFVVLEAEGLANAELSKLATEVEKSIPQ